VRRTRLGSKTRLMFACFFRSLCVHALCGSQCAQPQQLVATRKNLSELITRAEALEALTVSAGVSEKPPLFSDDEESATSIEQPSPEQRNRANSMGELAGTVSRNDKAAIMALRLERERERTRASEMLARHANFMEKLHSPKAKKVKSLIDSFLQKFRARVPEENHQATHVYNFGMHTRCCAHCVRVFAVLNAQWTRRRNKCLNIHCGLTRRNM
jgi:hypothetical protein